MTLDEINVEIDQYLKTVEDYKKDGYEMMIDLTAVDWYRKKEPRFEVIVNLLSVSKNSRLIINVAVPDEDLKIPSICEIYPGANFYEREVFDMFGIEFENHPELTRILMPDDWTGNPLRKDYGSGRIPVQFKNAPKVD
ncbi:MAG: NADH-quinone oxidoreductase subunit C [Actinomycetota bacterium]|jgi:NADH-quinone oxidoreductase subunit C|nr:NADH-quinone oxidoreductase subunit C [Actinomycetota bacterium]